MRIVANQLLDTALAVTQARTGASIDLNNFGSVDSLAIVVTASAASSPTGTTIQLSASLDGTNYVLLGSTVSVTANGTYTLKETDPAYRYYRVIYAWSSGSYTANTQVCLKGRPY